MPAIETWVKFPSGVRQHLLDRMRERAISIAGLNHLRLWIDSSVAKDLCRKRICFGVKPPRGRPSKETLLKASKSQ